MTFFKVIFKIYGILLVLKGYWRERMSYLIYILTNVILPIFIIIGIGFGFQKKLHFNTSTMAKLQFYIFIPALLFTKIYQTDVTARKFMLLTLIMVIIFSVLLFISIILSRRSKLSKKVQSSFVNSIIFFNSGNYCIPLLTFLFIDKPNILNVALSIQVIIMLSQSVLINTYGIFNTNNGSKKVKESLLETFKIPMIYAVIIALLLRGLHVSVKGPIWDTLDIIGNGMVPLALITLGAQLAKTKISFKMPKVYLSNFMRLVISPLLAIVFVKLFSITGVEAQVIVICSGAPTAVNTVLMAIEYDNEPELSSQIVFLSTLISIITMSILINFVQIMFPL